ncbi:hypothetical protein PGB90_008029 [Kerria lacca]
MSFLEWRRFNFFDLKKNVDVGSINRALGDTNVTATSCGHGTIVICDSEGVIHLINRNFQVTTFQGYLHSISLVEQLKSLPFLVTIGEDEIGSDPLVKIWDVEKRDRQGNPVCLKSFRTSPTNKPIPASSLCISDSSNLMAIGFVNGAIILYRGNITRDRVLKQKLLRNESDPITGLAFKITSKRSHLFVATTGSILQYNITVKDKEEEILLDPDKGCAIGCSVLADTIQDFPFMVAKSNAIYCYTVDGKGPCYAVDGPKVCLQWFRSYLIIVAQDENTVHSPVTVSSTNRKKDKYVITVLDIQNKFIVFSSVIQEIIAVLPEWGSFYILTKDRNLHHFIEKDLQSKLALLFKKNCYDICIRIAKSQEYDSENLIEIFRQYGDHLYNIGDHNGAIEQYIKTIGKLEPSYVIRKFLDSQYIDNLIKYLSALHKQGVATGDHTMLLLNCYTKMNLFHKLKEFILTKDRDIDFDLNVAISVCRKSSSEDALMLAEKHGLHLWYIKILLEDHKKYLSALQYIEKLEYTEAYDMVTKFGDTLVQHIPAEFTQFLKKLCTNYYPSNTLLLDQDEQQNRYQADPQDFIYLFLNNSSRLVEFLEYLIKFSSKWSTSIYNTLIEHYLHLWYDSNDVTVKLQYEQQVLNTLQSSEINYDKNQALILCSMRNFKSGILYLLEENKMYKQILRYLLSCGNYQDVLCCCRRFGYQEPSLWIKTLWSAASDSFFPSDSLCEVLTVIEKENLLSPLQVVEIMSRSQSLTIENIYNYMLSILKTELKLMEEENTLIRKYKEETDRIHHHVKKIQNSPIVFQGSTCSACKNQLELPSVHFLCQHSYHQYCYQNYVENENECPACLPNNQKILGVIKSQEQNKDLHEIFHSQLERAEDSFSLIADYFGRNVFNKIEVNTEFTKQFQQATKNNIKDIKIDNVQINQYKLSTEIKSNKIKENRVQHNMSANTNLTLEANIYPFRESPTEISVEESLSNAIENKNFRSNTSTNPFDDYDENKNPFFDDDSQDNYEKDDNDYDNKLNPFAT